MTQTNLSQRLLDQSKDLIWVIDSEFKLVFANERYQSVIKKITGQEHKLYDSAFTDYFGTAYIEKWTTYYTRALNGESFEVEDHHFNPKSNEIEYGLTSLEPLRDDDNKVFAVSCQSKNITRIVKQRSEANQMMDASLDVFCTVNEQGHFVNVSAAALNHWGYLPEELLDKAYISFIVEEDVPKTIEIAEAVNSGEEIKSFVNRYTKKDGSIAYNVWSARWDNEAKLMYCVARDGKEKLEQEEKIQLSEQRFKSLVQEGSDMVSIIDADGKYIYTSPTTTLILGITPEEFEGKTIFDFIHPEGIESAYVYMKRISTEKKVIVAPFRLRDGKNEWRWIETVLTNMLDNPAVKGFVANSRDVTDKINEQYHLKLLQSVITHTNDSVLITEAEPFDEPGPKIIYVNEAFTKMTGYSAAEIIGKTPRILQGPNTNKEALAELGRKMRNWEPCELTTINYKKNGEEFWIHFSLTPVADEKGWYSHWISIERDVTEQKVKALRNELLAQISRNFNADNDLIIAANELCKSVSSFGKFDLVEVWTANLEKSEMKLLTHHVANINDESFYEYSKAFDAFKMSDSMVGKVWAQQQQLLWDDIENNKDFLRREGAKKIGLKAVLVIPLLFNGEAIGVLKIGTKQGVHHLKNYSKIFKELESYIGSEINRKKLENDLNHLYQTIPDIMCIHDFEGRFLKINKAGCELLGYSEAAILYRSFAEFVHPDDKEITANYFKRLITDGKANAFESRYITKTGAIIWLSWTCDSSSAEGLIYATAKNITEEKKLRELNRQSRQLAKIGSWEVDLINQKIYWSEEVHLMHETDPTSFSPNLETAINFYREDFRQLVQSNIEKSVTTGEPFDFEAVLVTAKKKELWVRAIGNAEFSNNQCIRIYGSFQDINVRKETESRLLSFSENIPGIICQYVIHPDGTDAMQFISGMAEQLWGYTTYEVMENINLLWNQIKLGGDMEEVKASINKSIQTKSKWTSRYKIVKPNGELKTHLGNGGIPVFLADGRIVLNVIVLDITQEAKNEELLAQVTKLTKTGSWEMDLKTLTTYFSDETFRIYDLPVGLPPTLEDGINFYPPEAQSIIKEAVAQAIEHHTPYDIELPFVTASGNNIWVRTYGKAEVINGKAVRLYGAIQDITERKVAEIGIQKSEARFRSIFEIASLGIIQVDPLNGNILLANSYYETITGYSKGELVNMNFLDLTHPDDREMDWEKFSKASVGEEEYRNEKRYVKKDGSIVWVRIHLAFIKNETGKPIRTVAICEDISDRKEAENNLVESEQKYRLLSQRLELKQLHLTNAQHVAKVGSWETNLKDFTVNWSTETYRIFGIRNDGTDMTHEKFLNNVHPQDREKVDKALKDSTQDSERSYHFIEHRILTHTGAEKVVEERWKIDFDSNGVPLLAVGSCQDITDRKIAEEEKYSLQTTLENSLNEIYIFDYDTFKFSYVNKGALRNLGYSVNEIEALTPLDLKPDFTLSSFKNLISPLINNEKREIIFFTSHKRKDGSLYPTEIHLQLVSVGNKKRFVAIILDITQRKKAEELLQQASEIAKLGSWEVDLLLENDGKMYLSEMVREILEVDDSFTPTLKGVLEFYDGENSDKVQQAINNLIEMGVEFDEELIIRTAKGNSKWVRIIGKSLRVGNKCTKIYGSFQDINELKGALIKLENSFKELEDYKFSIDQSAIIAFTDKKGVITDVNDNFCNISGYNRHDLIGKTHQLINSNYHPKEFFIDLWTSISSGKVWRGEVKNKTKDGLFYWVYTTIVPFLDEKNKPFKYLAIRFDISARKKAEEEITFKANLLNTIEQAAIATNLDGIVNYWNKAAENIYGWSLEEAIGQSVITLTTPAPSKEQAMQIMEGLKRGQTWSGSFKVRKKNGTEFIALVSNSPVYDENNMLSGIIGVSTDITQQIENEELLKQYTQQLESSNERFEKVTEATNDVIWDWDIVNGTYYRSKAIDRFFGKGALKSLTGNDFWKERFHPEDLDMIKNDVQKAIDNPLQNRWELEYRIIHENGKTIYVIDRGIIIRNDEGKAIRMVGAMIDISEQKQMTVQLGELNQSLQKYTIELERSNQELEQFAFVASHDLQEPLRMISSFMNQLKRKYEDKLDEKAQQYIYFATDGAKRMKQIILDLLQFSRTGRPTEGKEEVDINEVIGEFIQLRRKLISEKKASITFEGLPTLNTYKAAISQIINCLLDNALKYTNAGTKPVVNIIAKETEHEWKFSIQDNGIGIDPQFYDKIFIIFQRLHNKEDYAGTGIGLSIAKRHVEFLGGQIWLESAVGKGTTFYFTIPKTT